MARNIHDVIRDYYNKTGKTISRQRIYAMAKKLGRFPRKSELGKPVGRPFGSSTAYGCKKVKKEK